MKHIMIIFHCVVISCIISLPAAYADQTCSPEREKKADLVIFSYDRPMQLYALCESIEYYVTGLGTITVIYRASDDNFNAGYQEVARCFPAITYSKQGDNPREDFKPLTLQAVFKTPYDYVLFAVDDMIVIDFIAIDDDINLLEQAKAYGFFYRLGTNLNYCYSLKVKQPVPPYRLLIADICLWQFNQGFADWNYPHTVDMTLYRKKDLQLLFNHIPFFGPNSLEAQWAGFGHILGHQTGLCHQHTKVINVPLNRVQNEITNRHMNSYTTSELLVLFNKGLKIDVHALYNIDNKSAHMEYEPIFISRA